MDLVLLLNDVLIYVVGNLRVQHWCGLVLLGVKHIAKLALQSGNLRHLSYLLLLQSVIFKILLPFLQQIFTHFHSLLEGLVPMVHDLLESLLVHRDHLLLVIENATGLLLLLLHPI